VFKTRRVRCPDGRKLSVYRNADDAFPVIASQVDLAVKSTVDVAEELRAGVAGEASRRVQELANRIDGVSRSLRERLRAVYVVYQADPCGQITNLAAEVNRINRQEERLREVAIAIEQVCELARQGASDAQLVSIVQELIHTLDGPTGLRSATVIEQRAREWSVEGDA
jgi:methyl-accepting chemotaxis protein